MGSAELVGRIGIRLLFSTFTTAFRGAPAFDKEGNQPNVPQCESVLIFHGQNGGMRTHSHTVSRLRSFDLKIS